MGDRVNEIMDRITKAKQQSNVAGPSDHPVIVPPRDMDRVPEIMERITQVKHQSNAAGMPRDMDRVPEIMERIAQERLQSNNGGRGPVNGQPGTVEQFIARNEIDNRAAQELLGESPAVQQAVIAYGPLTGCRNKSSAVMGRIRKAKQGKLSAYPTPAPIAPGVHILGTPHMNSGAGVFAMRQSQRHEQEQQMRQKEAGTASGLLYPCETKVLQEVPQEAQQHARAGRLPTDPEQQSTSASSSNHDDDLRSTPSEPSGDHCSEALITNPKAKFTATDTWVQFSGAVEAFIHEFGIDDKAAAALFQEDETVQQVVLNGGPLINARNKGAVIMDRITKAKKMAGLGACEPGTLDQFIAENDIDDKAKMALLHEDPEIQQVVLSAGPLINARNKGAVIMDRIAKAKKVQSNIALGQVGIDFAVVKHFIAKNGIDDKAAQELLAEDPAIQRAVIGHGPLTGVHNKSSAVIGRIRKAKLGKLPAREVYMPPAPTRPVILTCPPGLHEDPQVVEQQAEDSAVNQSSVESTIGSTWQSAWSTEHEAHYYWHTHTGETTWEKPTDFEAGTVQSPGTINKIPDEYLCVLHWQPDKEIESGMAVLHGDRLQVTWTDGCSHGWAYGHVVGDESKQGYFPQQCIAVPKRPPQNFVSGQKYKLSNGFEAPAWQEGYLSVGAGETISIVHQDQDANLWVYARREGSEESGWLPEAVIEIA